MGADRTLMQVKVRCGLGRVGVLGRLYGNSRGMSGVINGPDGPEIGLPLFPRKRTQVGHHGMSEKCQ
jgi:hypothetical protein